MDKLTLTVPSMYADHHVTNVKRLLAPMAGVENVYASAAFKQVTVEYNKAKLSQDQIVKAMIEAGYTPGEEQVVMRRPDGRFDPAWDTNGVRTTITNPVDNQLSGEFRKY